MNKTFKGEDVMPVSVVALAVFLIPTEQFLVFRRSGNDNYAGFWEFPGGKVEPEESLTDALVREIKEELNYELAVNNLKYVTHHVHRYPQKAIDLHVFMYSVTEAFKFQLIEHDGAQWCSLEELEKMSLAPADIPFIEDLRQIVNKSKARS